MKAVWKYPLRMGGSFTLQMPSGARPVRVAMQAGDPHMWAIVESEAEREDRVFCIYGTGHPIGSTPATHYVGTFEHGPFVWHLFEELQAEKDGAS